MSRYGMRRVPGLWMVLVVAIEDRRVIEWQEVSTADAAKVVSDNLFHQFPPATHNIVVKSPEEI